MSKLVLIDGNAILHRAYHALPSTLTTRKGEPINAVYGLVSMFLTIIADLKPTHIAVCFDRKEPTFRKKEFKDYQAHRPEMDKELSGQFEKAKDTLSAFGVPIYEKAGFEADDVIGTLARQATKGKNKEKNSTLPLSRSPALIEEVVIVTGDRDILQLVNDKVKVYMPIRGLKDSQLLGDDEVLAKMGVAPDKIVDFKALVGDPSDNYKGVPGIGPKTAITLLSKYKSVEGVYKNMDKIDESLAKKLKEGKDSANQSQKLAKIVTNVPVKLSLEDAGTWKVDSNKVLALFADYGFRTLTRRVKEVGAQMVSENQMELL